MELEIGAMFSMLDNMKGRSHNLNITEFQYIHSEYCTLTRMIGKTSSSEFAVLWFLNLKLEDQCKTILQGFHNRIDAVVKIYIVHFDRVISVSIAYEIILSTQKTTYFSSPLFLVQLCACTPEGL